MYLHKNVRKSRNLKIQFTKRKKTEITLIALDIEMWVGINLLFSELIIYNIQEIDFIGKGPVSPLAAKIPDRFV